MKGFLVGRSLLIILIALIYLECRIPLELTNSLSAQAVWLNVYTRAYN